MTLLRRWSLGVIVCVMMLVAPLTRAQVLKQLPADPMVVLKINNPQAISEKLGQWTQKLGLAQFDANLANPLEALKKQFNIKEGFDAKGEAAIGLYDPGQPNMEPHVVALLPVTDYKAFLGNLANVKQDGELTTFTMPDDLEPVYIANWGSYAAVSPTKELLSKKPAGLELAGLVEKQLSSNDVALYANTKLLAAKVLPELQNNRAQIIQNLEQELKNNPQINQKYVPLIKAVVNQFLNGAERILQDTQSATFGIHLINEGLNTTTVAQFEPGSYSGKLLAQGKPTDANLIAGLPNRKYFLFGGMNVNSAGALKWLDDVLAPISKELAALGDDAKNFMTAIDASRAVIAATEGISFGYVQPSAPPPQQGIIQGLAIYHGDAKKIAVEQRRYMQASTDIMKLFPQPPGISFNMDSKVDAKKVDGTSFDSFTMKFNVDPNNPAAAQAGQMMAMMYGADGMNGIMGAVDDKTFLMVMGGGDDLATEGIAAAKKQDTALSEAEHVKSVSAQLPKSRRAVFYIALDNVVSTVLDTMAMMGFKVPLKLPPDMPPIGVTAATDGAALRIDSHISSTFIENMVSAGMQAAMMMQGGGQKGGGL